MELVKRITELSKDLNEKKQHEDIDFIEFLRQEQLKEDIKLMDSINDEYSEVMKELAK